MAKKKKGIKSDFNFITIINNYKDYANYWAIYNISR